jgi:hypothetical protein
VIARSDADGRFVASLPAGMHDVAARWVGALPVGQRIRLADGDTALVVFRLSGAQRLPAITTVAAPRAAAGLAGFADRQRDEIGAFITADMLRGQEHRPLSGAIKDLATGVRFKHFENETIATGRGGCAMAIWVDGIRIYAGSAETLALAGPGRSRPITGLSVSAAGSDGPPNIDNFRIAEIVAIEVYAGPGRTPMQYQLTGSACGTVLIWTRVGLPTGL